MEDWPICDALIAFYSSGYPLEKAEAYTELRKPFVLNDLKMQRLLKDRRCVYDLLKLSGIDVPRHVFMNRDEYLSQDGMNRGDNSEEDLIEHDDHIEINGVTINKPFVEKPVDADDHNIAIYYPVRGKRMDDIFSFFLLTVQRSHDILYFLISSIFVHRQVQAVVVKY